MDGDILLLQLKELMKHHPTLKIILMSATINHEIFIKYFNDASLLTIPGFTHPVEDRFVSRCATKKSTDTFFQISGGFLALAILPAIWQGCKRTLREK